MTRPKDTVFNEQSTEEERRLAEQQQERRLATAGRSAYTKANKRVLILVMPSELNPQGKVINYGDVTAEEAQEMILNAPSTPYTRRDHPMDGKDISLSRRKNSNF